MNRIRKGSVEKVIPFAILWLLLTGCTTQETTTLVVKPESLIAITTEAVSPFSVVALDAEGREIQDPDLHWVSSAADVVTVDEEGVLTPIRSGAATITLSSGKMSHEIPVTVALHSKLVLPDEEVALTVGESRILKADLLDENDSKLPGEVVWQVADPTICEVTPNGEVIALEPGQTTVTAMFKDLTDTAKVVVRAVPAVDPAAVPVDPAAVPAEPVPGQAPQGTAPAPSGPAPLPGNPPR